MRWQRKKSRIWKKYRTRKKGGQHYWKTYSSAPMSRTMAREKSLRRLLNTIDDPELKQKLIREGAFSPRMIDKEFNEAYNEMMAEIYDVPKEPPPEEDITSKKIEGIIYRMKKDPTTRLQRLAAQEMSEEAQEEAIREIGEL